MSTVDGPLVAQLHAQGPDVPHADALQLFGQFVGSWDLEWRGTGRAGQPVTVRGALSFGWILEGRAIQDVWQVPTDAVDMARMRGFHGTTIRFYDPRRGVWLSTWIDPLNARVRRFVGRAVEGGIQLDSLDDEPRERWSFREITAESFLWVGHESHDNGLTWVLAEEMRATRRTGS